MVSGSAEQPEYIAAFNDPALNPKSHSAVLHQCGLLAMANYQTIKDANPA
jgi:hypothetical protein